MTNPPNTSTQNKKEIIKWKKEGQLKRKKEIPRIKDGHD